MSLENGNDFRSPVCQPKNQTIIPYDQFANSRIGKLRDDPSPLGIFGKRIPSSDQRFDEFFGPLGVLKRNINFDFAEPLKCFNRPNDFCQTSILFAPFF